MIAIVYITSRLEVTIHIVNVNRKQVTVNRVNYSKRSTNKCGILNIIDLATLSKDIGDMYLIRFVRMFGNLEKIRL